MACLVDVASLHSYILSCLWDTLSQW